MTTIVVKKQIHEKLFLLFSILLVVTLPFSVRLNSYAMILLSLNWLIEGNFKNKFAWLSKNLFACLLIGFYFYHVIGLFYTQNMEQGLFELEKRAGFVAFPIIFSSAVHLSKDIINKILLTFVSACFIAALVCLTNGLYLYIKGDSTHLSYDNLCEILNITAVYLSLYIAFSIFIVISFLKQKWPNNNHRIFSLYIALLVFLLVFLVMLSAKTILTTVFLLLLIDSSMTIFRKKGMIAGIASVIICITLGVVAFFTSNLKDRFKEVFIDKYQQTNTLLLDDYLYYHFTGANLRLAIWKMSIQIIHRENAWIFGVGTGDTQDLLTNEYLKRHVYPGDKRIGQKGYLHYNTHNQYLQFLLTLGEIGLIWFIVILVVFFLQSQRQRESLPLFMLIIVALFCLTESVLYVQKGIVFFTFFSSLYSNKFYFVKI